MALPHHCPLIILKLIPHVSSNILLKVQAQNWNVVYNCYSSMCSNSLSLFPQHLSKRDETTFKTKFYSSFHWKDITQKAAICNYSSPVSAYLSFHTTPNIYLMSRKCCDKWSKAKQTLLLKNGYWNCNIYMPSLILYSTIFMFHMKCASSN